MKALTDARTLIAFACVVFVSGCGGDTAVKDKKSSEKPKQETKSKVVAKAEPKEHDHSGWWCPEHGIPEEECSMCSGDFAKTCKEKGDWCDKHDRAMSQCFICKPERREFYAAKYRAKYGDDPPPIEDPKSEEEPKKEKKS